MSFKYTSHHHGWYAAQVPHGTTYVVLTLSLLIRPVWPSTYEELVSLSNKRNNSVDQGSPLSRSTMIPQRTVAADLTPFEEELTPIMM